MFMECYTNENMDAQVQQMASANLRNDFPLSKVILNMSYLLWVLSNRYTATTLFDTFSSSSYVLHSVTTTLHEVCTTFLFSCLWISFSQI
jgi:hypothetical protein